MRRKFTIERLPSLEHYGDWHDKPAKWIARCPTDQAFTQKFSTKRDAGLWRKVANRAETFNQACELYCAI